MKKSVLILLTFIPIVVGYIINFSVRLPVIGPILFYILPLLTSVFWFYVGRLYANSTLKTLPALFLGNAVGIISLSVYLCQYFLETDQTRNLALIAAAQMFSDSAPTYLLAKFAILFESQPNYIGRASMVALNVISILYMILIFVLGFIWGKKIKRPDR